MDQHAQYDVQAYKPIARGLHWWIALLVIIQLPLGLYMTYRGNEMPGVNEKGEPVKGVWDAVTGNLYSSHKIIGLTILLFVILRLLYRFRQGVPRPDPSVPPALTGASHFVHWTLYVLLIAVPVLGYTAISYGDYLEVFGIHLPAITVKNEDRAKEIFEWHETGAILLLVFALIHIAAAFYHRFVRKDRVVERMIPKRSV
ncbi:cytochrome b [Hyphomicrobium sp.]|uniref:cytochrome b n=1 Tax=Hyphomicrobium sp. TaxID=82 RepID=UPI002D77D6AE|nr:cytochrome b [Hyphomicrobium sp.]HET6390555.1 cytochrome b [Hyphomicrobium sp.]